MMPRGKYERTSEIRAKISASCSNRKRSAVGRANISAGQKKRFQDPEAREKLRKQMIEQWKDLEVKVKMLTGMNRPGVKAKKSASQKKFHQENPDHQKRVRNTLEVFMFIRRYGYPLVYRVRRKYYALNYRCNNPNYSQYSDYGGRGIRNLFTSLEHFLNYVINELGITQLSQIDGLVLDRIDNNGNYEPGNIRFVTHSESQYNRRNVE